MPNPNPTKARQAKREKRVTPGNLDQLKATLWVAIERLEEALASDEVGNDVGKLTRLAHAISQAATPYMKVIELGELEARIRSLEEAR
jgi:hypothetical protein